MLRDMEIRCWKHDHILYSATIGIPMLLLWVVGLPLGALFLISRKRDELHDQEQLSKYRILYQGLRDDVYYWEFINILRKTLLISVNAFFSGFDSMYKALVGTSILYLYLGF